MSHACWPAHGVRGGGCLGSLDGGLLDHSAAGACWWLLSLGLGTSRLGEFGLCFGFGLRLASSLLTAISSPELRGRSLPILVDNRPVR